MADALYRETTDSNPQARTLCVAPVERPDVVVVPRRALDVLRHAVQMEDLSAFVKPREVPELATVVEVLDAARRLLEVADAR